MADPIEIKARAHLSHPVALTENDVLLDWATDLNATVAPTAWMREGIRDEETGCVYPVGDRSAAIQIGVVEETADPAYNVRLTSSGTQTEKPGLYLIEVDTEIGGVPTTFPSGKGQYIELEISPDVGGA